MRGSSGAKKSAEQFTSYVKEELEKMTGDAKDEADSKEENIALKQRVADLEKQASEARKREVKLQGSVAILGRKLEETKDGLLKVVEDSLLLDQINKDRILLLERHIKELEHSMEATILKLEQSMSKESRVPSATTAGATAAGAATAGIPGLKF